MDIQYRTSLQLTASELGNYYNYVSPLTFQEDYLLGRTPDELAQSIFSIFAFEENKMVGCGFIYPSCEDEGMSKWINWRNRKLAELGTLYVVPEKRRSEIGNNALPLIYGLIDQRLDYVEEKNYFPFTITKHKGMSSILEGKAIKVEEIDGKYSEIKSLVRDCRCRTLEEMRKCLNCPYDDKILWLYLRFILKEV